MSQDETKGSVGPVEIGSWVTALNNLSTKLNEFQKEKLAEQAEKESTEKIAEGQGSVTTATPSFTSEPDGYCTHKAVFKPFELNFDGYQPSLVVEDVYTPKELPDFGVFSVSSKRGGPNGVYHETFNDWFINYGQEKVVEKITKTKDNPKYQELQDFLQKKSGYFNAEYRMKELEKAYTPEQQLALTEATTVWLKTRMEYEQHSIYKLSQLGPLDAVYFQPPTQVDEFVEKFKADFSKEDLSKLPKSTLRSKYLKEQMRKFGEVGMISRSEHVGSKIPPGKIEEIARRVQNVEDKHEVVQKVEGTSVRKIEEVFAKIQAAKADKCIQCQNPHFDGLCECQKTCKCGPSEECFYCNIK